MNWSLEEKSHNTVVVKMNSNKLNLMNDGFFDDLNNTLDIIEKDYPESPVVLTSEGSVFSAGLDIKQCLDLVQSGDMEDLRIWFERFRDSFVRLFSLAQPVICAVNGHAIGGGLILALCCDLRITGSSRSRFGLNEVTAGFPLPAALAEIAKHTLGTNNAEELIYRAKFLDPLDALKYGVFHELTENDDLMDRALDYAARYRDVNGMESYAFAKKALRTEVINRIEGVCAGIDERIPDILVNNNTKKNLEKVLRDLKKD